MQMLGMNGLQLLAAAQKAAPDTIRMMLTGNADLETAVGAVNDGNVFRFITKPCDKSALEKMIRAGIRQHRLILAEREVLEKTLNGAVHLCTELLAAADPRAAGLAEAARRMASEVASTLGIEDKWEIELAGMLARIGRATIPPVVLVRERAGKALSATERGMLERVPEVGHRLLSGIPRLEGVARIVLYAQKRFDGSGLPADDVKGERIPLEARILKAAHDLAEREEAGQSAFEALSAMKAEAGVYDPGVVEALFALRCAPDSGTEPVAIPFDELSIGQTLAAPIETVDGVLLVAGRTVVTKTLYERLVNYGRVHEIREPVYVAPEVQPAAASSS
jgi:response regulator RpfG family c-di-GMP phosphodiesterase